MNDGKQRHDKLATILTDLIMPTEGFGESLFRSNRYRVQKNSIRQACEPREALLSNPEIVWKLRENEEDLKIDRNGTAYLEFVQPFKGKQLRPIDFHVAAAIGSLLTGPISADDWYLICTVTATARVSFRISIDDTGAVIYSVRYAGISSRKDLAKTYD